MNVMKMSKTRVYFVVSNNKTVWPCTIHLIDVVDRKVILRHAEETREHMGARFTFIYAPDGKVELFTGVKTVSLNGRHEGFCDLYTSVDAAEEAVQGCIRAHLETGIAKLRATAAREMKRVRTEARAAVKTVPA